MVSRPDISYNVEVCARYQANPKESHITAVNRIINMLSPLVVLEFGMIRTLMMCWLDILIRTG